MASPTAEQAVRNYLKALKDPSALRDDDRIAQLREAIDNATDEIDRLRLRQQLNDAENPSLQAYEEAFVTHAKDWAEDQGVDAQAFVDEGVPQNVLRRARLLTGGRRGRSSGGAGRRTSGKRVSSDEVRAAIPKRGTFTTKQLQESSGASPQVVRGVIKDEIAAGNLVDKGADPDHQGPGRAPTLYARS